MVCWILRRDENARLACGIALAAVLGMALLSSPIAAQPSPALPAGSTSSADSSTTTDGVFTEARGVVWSPPSSARAARFALQDMAASGVTAVRITASMPALDRAPDALETSQGNASQGNESGSEEAGREAPVSVQEQIWAHAHALGIDIWLDLPLAYRSTAQLRRMDETIRSALRELANQANPYPAVRAIGLGTGLDTAEPETCDFLETWAGILRAELPGRAVYYVTPFQPETDTCASAVDGVLLDVRGRGAAPAFVQRWQKQTPRPVAIGAAGTWVDPSAEPGLSVPHSPQRQARELETFLTTWLPDVNDPLRPVRDELQDDGYVDLETADTRNAPMSVFVTRWKDAATPLGRAYGVYTSRGDPRPAADVLRGVYTETQRVFAFPSGEAPGPDAPRAVLFGWLIVGALAVIFARRPLFRRATVRYFSAHAFYCDSVREGRETMPVVNMLMLVLVSVATGVIAAVVAELLRPLMITEHVVMAIGPGIGAGLNEAIQRPVVAGVSVAAGVVVLLLFWALTIGMTVRQWVSLGADQVVMLIVWPCWPALLWMGAALVTASSGGAATAAGVLTLLIGVTTITTTVRVLRDVYAVSRLPLGVTLLLALASPATVLSVTALGLWARYDVSVTLVAHLFSGV